MPGPTVDPDGDQSAPDVPLRPAEGAARTPQGAPFATATVITLGCLVALGPFTTDLYLPALPDLTADLGSTAAAAQLTLTGSLLGMVVGQLLFGPLSDRIGRRRPMLAGLAAFTAASLLCAFADSMPLLVAGRVVQGAAGSAALVIARATVRDRLEGTAMIRFLATMGLISGLAPIVAPLAGAQLLHVTDWRGTFVALALLGAVLTVACGFGIGETLPPERRHGGGLGTTVRAIGGLLRDRVFLGYLLVSTFAFGALFAYVGGSSVVLQEVYRITPQTYSLVFAVNSVSLLAVTQFNGRFLVQRYSERTLLVCGLGAAALAGAAVVLCTTVWDTGLAGVWPALTVLMGAMGVILPNANGQALTMAPHAAGSASALLGTGTYLCGAVVAPLSSLGGHPSATVLGAVVLGCALLALGSFLPLCRGR
ncbi:multidrug effflux MFS transporter [Kitasatospora cineracea]|uniref:DHA1 family bicyclomycin/chloramphenicol resistance-like MFS transporter n=1 Tax=Kitasatospora cineracea TaxID=88074 RepID=A0A3N4RBS3_9ACTN|nr:multidrug effflux MFS transporter [Kitasatospora cineracea]ROR37761.1 DHA1 family bicyclomycin/chloramphenicol resistance-like MFS transporter [Kitasatospora cineracea]RPE28819.1 DHA1 family bicyclomycin/chloramphenicol resistance-like MFS transporter [Kitasatospora cineracea]